MFILNFVYRFWFSINLCMQLLHISQCHDIKFNDIRKNIILPDNFIIKTYDQVDVLIKCLQYCVLYKYCFSVSFNKEEKLCHLLNILLRNDNRQLQSQKGWDYYGTYQENGSPLQENIQYFYDLEERQLTQDYSLKTYRFLAKTWKVSFEIKPFERNSEWVNLFHATIGANAGNHGDRTPSISFKSNSLSIEVVGSVSDDKNHDFDTEEVQLNQYTSIEVAQRFNMMDRSYYFVVLVNGVEKHRVENNTPMEFQDVKLYASDNWHAPTNTKIKNLIFQNGGVVE